MWMRRLTVLLAAAGWLALLAAPALAAARVALVIGNANYAHAERLRNPANDVADVSASLRRLGFTVTPMKDAGQAAMRQGLQAFTRAAAVSDVALVFYAGHGIEVDGRNFLVPVDARLQSDQDVEFDAVPLDLVMRAVGRASGLGLVILDACRNNPFAVSMQRRGATRNIGRGLSRVEPSGETLVAYAAKGGTVAADGQGRNSPYTEALLRYLEEPGLEVGLLFRKVRDAVLASTGGHQEPFVYGSLSSREIYLTAARRPSGPAPARTDPPASVAAPAPDLEPELEMWAAVKHSTHPEDFEAYLSAYPQGRFARVARLRLRQLQRPASGAESQDVAPPSVPMAARLEACAAHLQANRLTTGAGGTAFACYQEMLREDPGNRQAIAGLAAIAERYRQWAEDAVQGAAWQRARGYLEKLRQVNPEHPALAVLESRVEAAQAGARRQREAERQRREREAQERGLGLEMVRVEGGSFTMGCRSGRDSDCYDTERPPHRVQVRSFEIGKYEVTQAQWEMVMGGNPSRFKGCAKCPVEAVSWRDVQAFLAKLNARTGGGYRLPTEAEWEYAARGGRRSRNYRYVGGNDVGSVAWYNGNSGNSGGRTHPVGRKRVNELGLHDMSGNVREWVQDCWNDSYQGAPGNGRAWERGKCGWRVVRGGSWYNYPRNLRSASRNRYDSGNRNSLLGFRLTRTLTP